jgi:hypothetical protein
MRTRGLMNIFHADCRNCELEAKRASVKYSIKEWNANHDMRGRRVTSGLSTAISS